MFRATVCTVTRSYDVRRCPPAEYDPVEIRILYKVPLRGAVDVKSRRCRKLKRGSIIRRPIYSEYCRILYVRMRLDDVFDF